MKKFLFIGLIILIGVFVIAAALKINKKVLDNSNKIIVITTLFPLYDFAKEIGGDRVEVILLLPPGVEPHSFEPKPGDIAKINQAQLFVYTGKFMEPWTEDVLGGVDNSGLEVVNASQDIQLIDDVFHDEDGLIGGNDPHIWLDFANARQMVDNITEGLVRVDPQNVDLYLERAETFKKRLSNLDNDYRLSLQTCSSREIVYGGHYAFGYLAKRYGLKYTAVQGMSPDAEPSVKDLMNLVVQIKQNKISTIFYEELTSPKIAETIAKETATKMLLLNAAHNLTKEDFVKGVTFLEIMQENLSNLVIGLECKK